MFTINGYKISSLIRYPTSNLNTLNQICVSWQHFLQKYTCGYVLESMVITF